VFWDAALAAVEPDAGAALPGSKPRATSSSAARRRSPARCEYAFKHNLLQQSAYDTLLRAAKVEAHARAGAFWRARADPADAADISAAHVRALAEAHFHGMRADAAVWADWFGSRFFAYYSMFAPLRPLAVRGPRRVRAAARRGRCEDGHGAGQRSRA
jgi:hypothetical protein